MSAITPRAVLRAVRSLVDICPPVAALSQRVGIAAKLPAEMPRRSGRCIDAAVALAGAGAGRAVALSTLRHPAFPPGYRLVCQLPDGWFGAPQMRPGAAVAAGDGSALRRAAAAGAHCPRAVLRRLACDPDLAVRSAAASQQRTPPDVFALLCAGELLDAAQTKLLSNPAFPPRLLRRATGTGRGYGPWPVAVAAAVSNPRFARRDFARLACYWDWNVREVVAAAPLCPAEIVESLVADDNDNVRAAAAANPNLPDHVMWQAAFGADTAVTHGVASNPSAAAELLEAIASECPDMGLAVAANSACSAATLARVAGPSANSMLRQSAASNPRCGQSHLRVLAAGPDRLVRRGAAANPSAPQDVIQALASDADLLVRAAVAENPRCPPAALAALAAETDDALRLAVAQHRNCPIPQLAALAEDREPVVRLAALPTLRQRLSPPRGDRRTPAWADLAGGPDGGRLVSVSPDAVA